MVVFDPVWADVDPLVAPAEPLAESEAGVAELEFVALPAADAVAVADAVFDGEVEAVSDVSLPIDILAATAKSSLQV